ncbi:hypothetical protein LOAG_13280, partial [Loa loa]
MTKEEKHIKGVRNVRIYIPINGSQTIDFGFNVRNVFAFSLKSDKLNERPIILIRNGRLSREG